MSALAVILSGMALIASLAALLTALTTTSEAAAIAQKECRQMAGIVSLLQQSFNDFKAANAAGQKGES